MTDLHALTGHAVDFKASWHGFWTGQIGVWILTNGLRIVMLVLGAMLATFGGFVGARLEAQISRSERQRDAAPLPLAYRYRKYDLEDGLSLVVRAEMDGLLKGMEGDKTVSIRALLETDPKANGTEWRQKLDSQRGSVLATEVRNNGNKRWSMSSVQ